MPSLPRLFATYSCKDESPSPVVVSFPMTNSWLPPLDCRLGPFLATSDCRKDMQPPPPSSSLLLFHCRIHCRMRKRTREKDYSVHSAVTEVPVFSSVVRDCQSCALPMLTESAPCCPPVPPTAGTPYWTMPTPQSFPNIVCECKNLLHLSSLQQIGHMVPQHGAIVAVFGPCPSQSSSGAGCSGPERMLCAAWLHLFDGCAGPV